MLSPVPVNEKLWLTEVMLSFLTQDECLQLMLEILLFFVRSSESPGCFHVSTKDGDCLCCAGVVPICCSTHANRSLTNRKRSVSWWCNRTWHLYICERLPTGYIHL